MPKHGNKTELYKSSLFPSTTILWNSLPESVQDGESIGEIKRYLSGNNRSVPHYLCFGDREAQVLHCRLRLNISDLNPNLVDRHLSQDASCTCGATADTVEHYLLYTAQITTTFVTQ